MSEAAPNTIAIAPGTWLDPHTAEPVAHPDLMRRLALQQVVLLGETHDRYDVHRWQLHVALGLLAHRSDIVLGFEMFPRRLQPVLDAFIAGTFATTEDFLEAAEWNEVWRFDPDLYLPLFHFCRQFRLPMLALNCSRPLVTRVGKEGWAAIPVDERDGLTPARPALPAYRDYLGNYRRPARPPPRRRRQRPVRPRPADLGPRLRLQHRPRPRWSGPAAGHRHHRPRPPRIRLRHALSARRSRHRPRLRSA